MKIFPYVLALQLILLNLDVIAQVSVKGVLSGKSSSQKITGATISLKKDKVQIAEAVSGENGEFELKNIPPGEYLLEVTSIGFNAYSQRLVLTGNVELAISLTENI